MGGRGDAEGEGEAFAGDGVVESGEREVSRMGQDGGGEMAYFDGLSSG